MSKETNVPIEWEISNSENGGQVIDTRNIAQRLDDMADEWISDEGEAIVMSEWSAVAQAEYAALTELLNEVGRNVDSGWELSANGDSLTLVRETYVAEYVKYDYADRYNGDLFTEDRYGNKTRLKWDDLMDREPFKWLDWDAVAKGWKDGRAEVEYHGVTYILDF